MAVRTVMEPALEEVVVAFSAYQLRERRLAESTVERSWYDLRLFLAWRSANGRGEVATLGPAELGEYVVELACRLKPTSVGCSVTTLRRFCRFLYATGRMETDLSGAVPSVAVSRFGQLRGAWTGRRPGGCWTAAIGRRATGRRGFAVLMLMRRLGLRAVEVSRLRLGDLDWRAGEISVTGKAGRLDRLPLPADVGDAIVDYLRFGRPRSDDRRVFLRALPPAGRHVTQHGGVRVPHGVGPGRRGDGRRSPAAPYRGRRTVGWGRFAARGRPGAASQRRHHHRHLRQSGTRPA